MAKFLTKIVFIFFVSAFLGCNTDNIKKNNIFTADTLNLDAKKISPFHEFEIIERENADSLKLIVAMENGILHITQGKQHMISSGFAYTNPNQKPQIQHAIQNGLSLVKFTQKPNADITELSENQILWSIEIIKDIPMLLKIEFGGGSAIFEKKELDLNQFYMTMGTGKSMLDFSGNWKRNGSINIVGGVGKTVIILPKQAGIHIELEKDIGEIELHNFVQKTRTRYINDNFEQAKIQLDVKIKSGFGKIEVRQK